jgi:HK97 family phage major capsid protein
MREKEDIMETSLRRDSLLAEARTILSKTSFDKADSSRCEQLMNLADRCGPQAMSLRRAKTASAELELGIRNDDNAADAEVEAEFRRFLVGGQAVLSDKTKKEMAGAVAQTRAEGEGSGILGGVIVPSSFRTELEIALKAYDGLVGAAGLWRSATGSAATVPILNDVSSTATVVPENGLSTEADVNFDSLSFGKCPTLRSGIVTVSMELAADTYFDLSGLLAQAFGVRFARAIGKALVAALVAGADVGVSTASPSTIAPSELLDAMSSLDSAYWAASSWAMNKDTLISLLKAGMVADISAQATTMWLSRSLRLFDKPIVISPSMDSIGAGNKPISFGDHSKLLRREVANSLTVKTLEQRFAEYGQTGWTAMWRCDAGFLKPAPTGSPATSLQSPCQLIQCHA